MVQEVGNRQAGSHLRFDPFRVRTYLLSKVDCLRERTCFSSLLLSEDLLLLASVKEVCEGNQTAAADVAVGCDPAV